MVLPEDFKDFSKYFEEITIFLQKHSWLYETPVTSLLACDVFSKIPKDWLPHLLDVSNDELNSVPTGLIKDDWPSSLIQFSQECKRFTLPALNHEKPLQKPFESKDWLAVVPREIWRGMSPKKKDEVELMFAFVHRECRLLSISKILDIGSGLGYIDRLLLLHGYRIIGVESQAKLVSFATTLTENFFPPTVAKNLQYHHLNVSASSMSEMRNIIENDLHKIKTLSAKDSAKRRNNENVNKYDWEKLISLCEDLAMKADSEKVCLIGLHACGDLAVTGMKLFLRLPEVSAFVLVPCCYHKMSLRPCCTQTQTDSAVEDTDNENCDEPSKCDTGNETCPETFKNFPLSEELSRAVARGGGKFVCRPFLRLANQTTNTGWQGWSESDHQRHAFNVLSRAVIELFTQQQGALFKKCFRRVVKKTSLKEQNFTSYINESLSRCEFVNQKYAFEFEKNQDQIRKDLLDMWEQHQDKLRLIEIITALQMCLEPVAESLVVADRACFLQENGSENVNLVRIIDNKLSPRCLAFIASKQQRSLHS